MAITEATETAARTVTLSIDGREVTVPEGTTIWTAAKSLGIEIPALCHDERYDPVGVCRTCAVDVGGRVYAASCVRPCEDGMEVKTNTEDLEAKRSMLTEMLLADQPPETLDPKEITTGDNELLVMARRYGLKHGDDGHRQRPLPDRAVLDHRQRRAAARMVSASTPVIWAARSGG